MTDWQRELLHSIQTCTRTAVPNDGDLSSSRRGPRAGTHSFFSPTDIHTHIHTPLHTHPQTYMHKAQKVACMSCYLYVQERLRSVCMYLVLFVCQRMHLCVRSREVVLFASDVTM